MIQYRLSALVLGLTLLALPVSAETLNEYCLRLSADWSSPGDVETACTCFTEIVAQDDALSNEFLSFDERFSNDTEAYENSSAGIKAAYDQCDVEF